MCHFKTFPRESLLAPRALHPGRCHQTPQCNRRAACDFITTFQAVTKTGKASRFKHQLHDYQFNWQYLNGILITWLLYWILVKLSYWLSNWHWLLNYWFCYWIPIWLLKTDLITECYFKTLLIITLLTQKLYILADLNSDHGLPSPVFLQRHLPFQDGKLFPKNISSDCG